jgi:hypothetical protein
VLQVAVVAVPLDVLQPFREVEWERTVQDLDQSKARGERKIPGQPDFLGVWRGT